MMILVKLIVLELYGPSQIKYEQGEVKNEGVYFSYVQTPPAFETTVVCVGTTYALTTPVQAIQMEDYFPFVAKTGAMTTTSDKSS